ncbi:MAG: YkgJ family cysteine cluster protein [Bacteroidales bacterium]|nr:YkgJ family cysteine cluster protein [Bacteroidales bacterium]
MLIDPEVLRRNKELAESQSRVNKNLLDKLKNKRPRDLDNVVLKLHNETFSKIDCLQCANCCKSISPILYPSDMERIAGILKIRYSEFVEKYVTIDEDNDYVFKETPCPMLDTENNCLVYHQRPKSCREYPHTDQKRFYQVLKKTYLNTFICPGVNQIVDGLKKIYQNS